MVAGESAFNMLHKGSTMEAFWDNLRNSWVWSELYKARNYRPVSNYVYFFYHMIGQYAKIDMYDSFLLTTKLVWIYTRKQACGMPK